MNDKYKHYYENLHAVAIPARTGNVARHWQSRYPTGKAFILADEPEIFTKHLYKQWLRLTSVLQTERTAAVGADDILRLTGIITRMQHMVFTSGLPAEQPTAHVWCSNELPAEPLLPSCHSVYILRPLEDADSQALRAVAPSHSLFIDYTGSLPLRTLAPKSDLIVICDQLWHELEAFLAKHNINITALTTPSLEQPAHLDDALDTLLGISSSFLRIAHQFQEARQLAQPLDTSYHDQQAHEAVLGMARRVAALSPSYFSRHMFTTHGEEEFFMYDHSLTLQQRKTITESAARHLRAGRRRLAAALEGSVR